MQNIKKHILALLICWLCVAPTLTAQEIWPGDINNNGRVNAVDLLYWGLAFGESGPARAEVNSEWEAIPLVSPWGQNFANGVDYAYADCDGNGLVDEDDYDDAIEDNFGLTRGTPQPDGYTDGVPGNAPRLQFQTDNQVVPFGATVNIDLSLDDSAAPLADFYGMALHLSYTTEVLAGDDGLEFEFESDSWVAADNSYVQDLFVDIDEAGQGELAITRTNQQAIPVAAGRIGRFSIVIEDIIVGRTIDTFRLQIDSVLLFNKDQTTVPVVRDEIEIIITNDPAPVSTDNFDATTKKDLQIFPNPARREFFLKADLPLSEAWLVNSLGQSRPLPLQATGHGRYRAQRPDIPPGVYHISARTPAGWIRNSIIFLH